MFEKKHEPLLPPADFVFRLDRSFNVTLLIVAVSLLMGSVGYRHFAQLSWIDSLLNAAMILTGMGPVDHMPTSAGKLFSTICAFFSSTVLHLPFVDVEWCQAIMRFPVMKSSEFAALQTLFAFAGDA